jgi:hypothetical protein
MELLPSPPRTHEGWPMKTILMLEACVVLILFRVLIGCDELRKQ